MEACASCSYTGSMLVSIETPAASGTACETRRHVFCGGSIARKPLRNTVLIHSSQLAVNRSIQ